MTSRAQVTALLESCGLSKSNTYNIVPQGKVAKLTTMKESERLDLFKEIGGVHVRGPCATAPHCARRVARRWRTPADGERRAAVRQL